MATKKKLVLLDSHALIHRAYHALPPMSTRDGTPTNAVFGFATMLLKVLQTLKPTHVVAAFDEKGPTFRHEEYEDYKAGRSEADDDLVEQFPIVRQLLQAFNIPVISKKRFEADDIIGTLVEKLDGAVQKIIVTGDMDALQLVDDDTVVFTMKRGITDTITYDEAAVRERFGFGPEFVTDYKGLAGDSSDNIPGVEGIGDKTAKDLVSKYGGIEEIFEHLEELPTRAKNRLDGRQEEALFSRQLATIKKDVKVKFDLDDALFEDFDPKEVKQILIDLDFKSLLNKIPASKHASETTEAVVDMPKHYHLVETTEEKKKLQEKLLKKKVIAFDTETDALGAVEHPIIGMSFADGKDAWYVPVMPAEVPDWRELLESEKVGKVGHNLKYDIQVLRQSGVELGGVVFDSLLSDSLLYPDRRQHNLDEVAEQELGRTMMPISELIGPKKDGKMSEVPLDKLAYYAAEDAEVAFAVYQSQAPRVKENGLTRVFGEVELPLVKVLADIELAGVALDAVEIKKIQKKVVSKINSLQKNIWELSGKEFNINSTQQLREVLFQDLKLPTFDIKRTQSGFSTAASELQKLRGEHEIISLLEEYRELAKLNNTYLKTLPTMLGEDGRIHTQYHQLGAATGRISSTDPNLQNIPIRTEIGQQVRGAFVAQPGHVLIKADYSQLELRLAAHLSQDENMLTAFRNGEDIHTATAALVNDVKLTEVTPTQRRTAKALNFGVLYGMGPQKFAREAGVSMEEARSYIERYLERYEQLADYRYQVLENAEELGFVETIWGRRRYVPELEARSPAIRAAAERAAFNFPIQGTGADILKKAMVDLAQHFQDKKMKAKMILTVHDEIVVEAPEKEAATVAQDIVKIMSGVIELDIPLVVDAAQGPNWLNMQSSLL